MRNVKFKCALLLIVTTLLFSCKGTQKEERAPTYQKVSAEVYIYQDTTPTPVAVLFSVLNRRSGQAAFAAPDQFTVTTRKAELRTYDLELLALPGDTLSYYLVVGAERPFRYIFSYRLGNQASFTVDGNSVLPITKRMDVIVK